MTPFVKIKNHTEPKFPDYWLRNKQDILDAVLKRRELAGIKVKTISQELKKNCLAFWKEDLASEYFQNDTYHIRKQRLSEKYTNIDQKTEPTWLSIKRHDREAFHDWRVMQEIKNAICGDEWEGIEIYPAESRLVDTCNQYHLICFNEQVPIWVFNGRSVSGDNIGKSRQRAFNE